MDERREIRVSDKDRQAAVDRLQAAMDEGRLNLFEYDNRLAQAYQSTTYGELADLFVDLPAGGSGAVARHEPSAAAARPVAHPEAAKVSLGLPIALKILWTVWGAVMAINLTVWFLTGVGNGELDNFWPVWFLVPGAALLAATVGVQAIRKDRAQRRALEPARRTVKRIKRR
ncbi:DUF1707 SHOCT-like domain-containing protein [Actinokineospora xionganensis]|uniref:DUF1707 domain-containing protein n=1 Tax=Actinokineospora xionganensis TaxID=2684470 RepID=A0ABR7L4J3_9PSEU|nr:DUF1707 domain-containing protein [Actinokineospora xionganensis]MBC6447349.1 DUF1707 domain-containing protein [Actinokineospora xionganensis]